MSFLNRNPSWAPALALALSLASGAAVADVVPVVSAKSPVYALSKNEVIDIFLGKLNRFPDGEPAVPIDQAEGTEIRDDFYMEYANRSPAQIKAYWSKIVFTGEGQPPREVSPSERVKKVLADHPNFIGYIERSEVDSKVKIVVLTK